MQSIAIRHCNLSTIAAAHLSAYYYFLFASPHPQPLPPAAPPSLRRQTSLPARHYLHPVSAGKEAEMTDATMGESLLASEETV